MKASKGKVLIKKSKWKILEKTNLYSFMILADFYRRFHLRISKSGRHLPSLQHSSVFGRFQRGILL